MTTMWGSSENPPWVKISKKKDGHDCVFQSESSQAGAAVTYCFEEEGGRLWVGNSEYENQVNFCPGCGKKADVQIGESK